MSRPLLALFCAALATGAAQAGDPRAEIAGKLPGQVKAEELSPTPIPGVYELRRGAEIGYVSSDGRYYISGEMHDLQTRTNVTEQRRGDARRKILATVPKKEMLIFGPDTAKYAITVFTDVDCGYCRKLHADVPELNNLDIQVRYLFYPRSGPGTASWKTAEAIWCSADRNQALTRAKRGERVEAKSCDAGAVARQYELGQKLEIRGTPGIFTDDGAYLPGYLPPRQMLATVQQAQ